MKKMKDSRTSSIVLHNLLIAVLAFIWLVPIIWLVCTSFSAYSGMNTSTFFPKEWSITNYLKLFHPDSVSQFPQWFLNTFIIACFTCVISTMFVLMVAYATSVMRFKMRKPLMNMAVILNLFPGMLAMIAVYFTLKSFNLTNSYAGLIMVYSASFMFSWGPICWVLIAEVFPNTIRGAAVAIAVAFQWIFNWIVSTSFVPMANSLGYWFTYGLYGVICILAAIFVWKLVPETKGKTLEDMTKLWKKE